MPVFLLPLASVVGVFELTSGLSLSVAGGLGADHPAGPGRPGATSGRLHTKVHTRLKLPFTLEWSGRRIVVFFCN